MAWDFQTEPEHEERLQWLEAEVKAQGPSGPAERKAQGPSGPAERKAQGPQYLIDGRLGSACSMIIRRPAEHSAASPAKPRTCRRR